MFAEPVLLLRSHSLPYGERLDTRDRERRLSGHRFQAVPERLNFARWPLRHGVSLNQSEEVQFSIAAYSLAAVYFRAIAFKLTLYRVFLVQPKLRLHPPQLLLV